MKHKLKLLLLMLGIFLLQNAGAQQKGVAYTLEGINDVQRIVDNAQSIMANIDKVVESVKASNAYHTLVDGKSISPPFGVATSNCKEGYELIINRIFLDATNGMSAEIFMRIPFNSGRNLYFMADKVPLTKNGKVLGDCKLYLVGSQTFKIGSESATSYSLTINGLGSPGGDSSYVQFNCKGFKDLRLQGSVNFDPNTIQTYKADGSAGDAYSTNFHVEAQNLTNFLIEIDDVPDLQFADIPGFKLSVENVIIDRSETENAENFVFPEWYKGYDNRNNFDVLWEGIVLKGIKLDIPKSLSEGDTSVLPITSDAFILDPSGISAIIDAKNIVDNGNIGGFKFTLDKLSVDLQGGTTTGASFAGTMVLPISDSDTLGIRIDCSKNESGALDILGSASLANGTKPIIDVNLFSKANLTVTGCAVNFAYRNHKLYPSAILDGTLEVGEEDSDVKLNLMVGGLKIDSKAPYLDLVKPTSSIFIAEKGGSGFIKMTPSGNSLGKLPITFKEVSVLKESDDRFKLQMELSVILMKSGGDDSEGGCGMTAAGAFSIWAKQNTATKKWKYDDFQVDELSIGWKQGPVSILGEVKFFGKESSAASATSTAEKDKGFCGFLDLKVIDKIAVQAAVIFGSTPEFRYWFVDAQATIMPAIPIASGIELNSFLGGLYHHMTMSTGGEAASPTSGCRTASGRTFIKDRKVFLGLMAGVGLQSAGGGNAFNGKLNLGIEFDDGGGVLKLATWGGVGFFSSGFTPPQTDKVAATLVDKEGKTKAKIPEETSVTNVKPDVEGSVVAGWFVSYDVRNRIFKGDFEVFMNLAGIVTGIGPAPDYSAGRISMYAADDKWYIYVGQPLSMTGINLLNIVTLKSYMCVGSVLPNPPIAPMPEGVMEKSNIDYSMLRAGGGFSFGSRLIVDGNAGAEFGNDYVGGSVSMSYYLEAGFDILLSQSSNDIKCATTPSRGFQRWYATGQAFIYGKGSLDASGTVGVKGAKVSFSETLADAEVYAYLFAQLPNPTYLEGKAGVEFNVRGRGFEKDFDIQFGDICSSKTEETVFSFIDNITPNHESKDVSVYSSITVSFMDKLEDFTYTVQNVKGTKNSEGTDLFRFRLHALSLKTKAGAIIECKEYAKAGVSEITLVPLQIMPDSTEMVVTVSVIIQRKDGDKWTDFGAKSIETMSVTFTTGKELKTIPEDNIDFAYPVPKQENFLIDETDIGYISLRTRPIRPMTLSTEPAGTEFMVGFFELDQSGKEVKEAGRVKATCEQSSGYCAYTIPTKLLKTNTKYQLKLMKTIPTKVVTTNASDKTTTVETLSHGKVQAETKKNDDFVVLSYPFETSQHRNFHDKIANYGTPISEVFNGVVSLSFDNAQKKGVNFETFDEAEKLGYVNNGTKRAERLIQIGSMLNNSFTGGQTSLTTSGSKVYLANDALAAINNKLKNQNLDCLLTGSCNGAKTEIPAGEFIIPIEYRLPGKNILTSTYTISIKLDQPIILPQ